MNRRPWITVEGRRRRFRWLRLHLAVTFGDGSKPRRALEALHALRDEFGEADFHAVYEGKFLLQSGDPVAAREAYFKAFEAARYRSDPIGKFVRYVTEGWLGLLDGSPHLADRCFALANEVQVEGLIRHANPGRVINKPDKFDREFEKWMRRNHPTE